ncbi:MAG: CVNH domain-containing protein [Myxococcota bacterium]
MRAFTAFIIAFAALLMTAPAAASVPVGSYQRSCRACTYQKGMLACQCKNRSGKFLRTALAPKYCTDRRNADISNQNGVLTCSRSASLKDSYNKSCDKCTLTGDGLLGCRCRSKKGRQRFSRIKVEACKQHPGIHNDDGRLVCPPRKQSLPVTGSFAKTCRACDAAMVKGGYLLNCECKRRNGSFNRTRLWTPACAKKGIANNNGVLTCTADANWSPRIRPRDASPREHFSKRYLHRCRKRAVVGANGRVNGECKSCIDCPFFSTSIELAKCKRETVVIDGGKDSPAKLVCEPTQQAQLKKARRRGTIRRR